MTARRKKAALILLALIACALALCFWPSFEPSYQGKTLSRWISGFEFNNRYPTAKEQAALRAMGQPAVKSLIVLLQSQDSALNKQVMTLARRNRWLNQRLIASHFIVPEYTRHNTAALALGEMGPPARAAIPALLAATNIAPAALKAALMRIQEDPVEPLLPIVANTSATNWQQTVAIVGLMGTNAEAAVPILVNQLKSTNSSVRYLAIQSLGGIASRPELVIPAIFANVRTNGASSVSQAVRALARFDYSKPQALSLLLAGMQDTNYDVWFAADLTFGDVDLDNRWAIRDAALTNSLTNANPVIREAAADGLRYTDPAALDRAGIK